MDKVSHRLPLDLDQMRNCKPHTLQRLLPASSTTKSTMRVQVGDVSEVGDNNWHKSSPNSQKTSDRSLIRDAFELQFFVNGLTRHFFNSLCWRELASFQVRRASRDVQIPRSSAVWDFQLLVICCFIDFSINSPLKRHVILIFSQQGRFSLWVQVGLSEAAMRISWSVTSRCWPPCVSASRTARTPPRCTPARPLSVMPLPWP